MAYQVRMRRHFLFLQQIEQELAGRLEPQLTGGLDGSPADIIVRIIQPGQDRIFPLLVGGASHGE